MGSFLWSVVLRAVFFTALYFIMLYFTEQRLHAAFLLLFFLVPFFITGSGHETLEKSLTYRTFSISFCLTYLALYLFRWRFLSLIPLLAAFTVHAITAIPFFLAHTLLTLGELWYKREKEQNKLKIILVGSIPFIGAISFLLFQHIDATGSFFLKIDEAWKQLANPRNTPAFFAFWDMHTYLSLAGWVAFASVPLFSLRQFVPHAQRRQVLLVLIIFAPLLLLGSALVGEYTLFYGIVKLNLQRGFLLVTFFAPILFGMYALWHAENNRDAVLSNFFLFAVMIALLAKQHFVFLREQFLLFVPSLVLLSLPWFSGMRSHGAIALLMFFAGAVTQRAIVYHDGIPLLWFYITCAGGIATTYFYATRRLTTSSLVNGGLGASCIILLAVCIFSAYSFTIQPKYFSNRAYLDACAWIQSHTSKDSIFIVEPFVSQPPPETFRLACLRSLFTSYKEGGGSAL